MKWKTLCFLFQNIFYSHKIDSSFHLEISPATFYFVSTESRENSVSRLNEAQQQYDKCVNMQIVNLFPLIFFLVCDNISLISLFASPPPYFIDVAIWCRAFHGTIHCKKGKRNVSFAENWNKIKIYCENSSIKFVWGSYSLRMSVTRREFTQFDYISR